MKQSLLNLLFSLIAFCLSYGIALLTGLELIQHAVLIAFLIQWVAFIPAYFFQTEKFYDLAGSCTYLFMVGYVSFTSYSSLHLNTASILLASCISLWAIRLGTFLFLRIFLFHYRLAFCHQIHKDSLHRYCYVLYLFLLPSSLSTNALILLALQN